MGYKNGLLFIKQKSSRMFLLAFLVSLTIWFLINLSKNYERNVIVHVSYTNLDHGTFVKKTDSVLKVKIEGSGFSLMTQKLHDLNVNIDTQKVNDTWVWEADDSELYKLFSKSISVKNVLPKTIHFEVKTLSSKKVPIIPEVKVKPKLGYGITSHSFTKDSVYVYGEEGVVDSITFIKTNSLVFENSSESIQGQVALKYANKGIEIDAKKIGYSYEIEQFTQGEFSVDVKIKNALTSKRITIFPKVVQVQFQGPLSQFSKYEAEGFSVYVDVNDINETNTLPIYIEYVPDGVVKTRVLKKSVTYLVLEK